MQNERPTYEDLESENKRLTSKLQRIEAPKRAKRGITSWFGKRLTRLFIGKRLEQALKEGLDGYRGTGRLSNGLIAAMGDAIFKRLARVGFVGVVMGALPLAFHTLRSYLMDQQNSMLTYQNQLLLTQNKGLEQ